MNATPTKTKEPIGARAVKPHLHCQICGRAIKAKTGLIAHHGYRRPGAGWQTASCLGARELPYEVSRARIPSVTQIVAEYQAKSKELLARHIAEPPATMIWSRRNSAWDRPTLTEVARPEGFNAEQELRRGSYSPGEYANLYQSRAAELKHSIESDDLFLIEMGRRWSEWVAPAQAEQAS